MEFKKELSKNEKYVIRWFEENGFKIIDVKQYITKTKFKIIKNGEEDIFELLNGVTDIKKYMEMYDKNFKMKLQIKEMKMK